MDTSQCARRSVATDQLSCGFARRNVVSDESTAGASVDAASVAAATRGSTWPQLVAPYVVVYSSSTSVH